MSRPSGPLSVPPTLRAPRLKRSRLKVVLEAPEGLQIGVTMPDGRHLGLLGGVPVEVSEDAITVRPDLLRGLAAVFGPRAFHFNSLQGRWPDALFAVVHDTNNGDVFRWNDGWKALHPPIGRDGNGYVESWHVQPWIGGRWLAAHAWMNFIGWKVLGGPGGNEPPPPSRDETVLASTWFADGRLVWLAQEGPFEGDVYALVAKHWRPSAEVTRTPLPGLTPWRGQSVSMMRNQRDVYALADNGEEGQLFFRWRGASWERLAMPRHVQGPLQLAGPTEQGVMLSAKNRLYRFESDHWTATQVSTPDGEKLSISAWYRVGTGHWATAFVRRDGDHRAVLLHDGEPAVPSAEELAATWKAAQSTAP